jgi:ribosomal protein S18 acetylase RimI-like enzyme
MSTAAISVRIRPAQPSDYAAYAHLFPQLRGQTIVLLREAWIREDQPYSLMAEVDGTVVGYVLWSDLGHIGHLVVDEQWRGRRVGEQLLQAAANILRRRGLTEWTLNVREENRPAIKLYERMGFRPWRLEYELCVPWASVRVLPREKRRMKAYRILPPGDARIEKELRLEPGALTAFRQQARDNVVAVLRLADGRLVGMCAFSPSFATVERHWFFGEARAGPLFTALSKFREPDDEAFLLRLPYGPLFKVLRRYGATAVLSLLHMKGPIPDDEADSDAALSTTIPASET